MKAYLFLLVINLMVWHNVHGQNCMQLPSGTYKIEYDSMFRQYPGREFKLINDKWLETANGQSKEYTIKRFGLCAFRPENNEIIDTTNFTAFQKAMNGMKPYFDIYKVEGNSYYFINRINLHIQSYSGRFIKTGGLSEILKKNSNK